jgi:hypothetical protein
MNFLCDFLGYGSVAPESVARKVLGIGAGPLHKAGIKAAFRLRLKLLRPDLTDDQAEALRLRDLLDETDPPLLLPGDTVQFATGSKAEQIAELLWAREDLERRLPPDVTANSTSLAATPSSRNAPAEPPPVTADTLRSRGALSSRNARILAEVERRFEYARHWRSHAGKTEPEVLTNLAVEAGLICADCHELPRRRVYLEHRYDGYGSVRKVLCGRCGRRRERENAEDTWGSTRFGRPSRCNCGIAVVRIIDTYYKTIGRGLCSPSCERLARNAELRERRRSSRGERICEDCGGTFTPPRADGRYCSAACRQRAYRKRSTELVAA